MSKNYFDLKYKNAEYNSKNNNISQYIKVFLKSKI